MNSEKRENEPVKLKWSELCERVCLTNTSDSLPKWWRRCLYTAVGAILGLLSGIFNGFAAFFITLVQNDGMPVFQAEFFMNVGILISILPYIIYRKQNILGNNRKDRAVLILIGLLWFGFLSSLLYSLKMGHLATMLGIFHGGLPIATPIIAYIVIRETPYATDGVVIVINIVAIILLSQDRTSDNSSENTSDSATLGYALAFLASIQLSLLSVLARYLEEHINFTVVLFYISAIAGTTSLILTFVVDKSMWSMGRSTALETVAFVILSALAEACRFEAFQLEEATTVTLLANIQLFVAFVLQVCILSVLPNGFAISGACLVLLGSFICATGTWWRDYQSKQKEKLCLLNKNPQNNLPSTSINSTKTVVSAALTDIPD